MCVTQAYDITYVRSLVGYSTYRRTQHSSVLYIYIYIGSEVRGAKFNTLLPSHLQSCALMTTHNCFYFLLLFYRYCTDLISYSPGYHVSTACSFIHNFNNYAYVLFTIIYIYNSRECSRNLHPKYPYIKTGVYILIVA